MCRKVFGDRRDLAILRLFLDTGMRLAGVESLFGADRIQDLYQVRAFDLHPLTGDRAGQYAMRLTGQMRLILTIDGDRNVTVEEVTDYHA